MIATTREQLLDIIAKVLPGEYDMYWETIAEALRPVVDNMRAEHDTARALLQLAVCTCAEIPTGATLHSAACRARNTVRVAGDITEARVVVRDFYESKMAVQQAELETARQDRDTAQLLLRLAVCTCTEVPNPATQHQFTCRAGDGTIVVNDIRLAQLARAAAARSQATVAELRAQQLGVERDNAVVESKTHQQSYTACARDLYLANTRIHELLTEREDRFDCHAGPGTTEPACGCCTTCLQRELDAVTERARQAEIRSQQMQHERDYAIKRSAELESLVDGIGAGLGHVPKDRYELLGDAAQMRRERDDALERVHATKTSLHELREAFEQRYNCRAEAKAEPPCRACAACLHRRLDATEKLLKETLDRANLNTR